jgi:ribosomal protein L5
VCDPKRVVNVRGISSSTERKLGEIEMGLSSENYESIHIFQIVGDRIRIRYDGILGKDFFISKKARIDYKKREIIMGA